MRTIKNITFLFIYSKMCSVHAQDRQRDMQYQNINQVLFCFLFKETAKPTPPI